MKKKITLIVVFACLLLVGITGVFWSSAVAEAATDIWNSCTHNMVDCPYPGQCHSYIDTNNDNICDRSQSNPELTETVDTAVTDTNVDTGSSDITTATQEVSYDITVSDTTDTTESTGTGAQVSSNQGNNSVYYFFPILLAGIIPYATTWLLAKKKVIRMLTHRKIWNLVLLVAAFVSAILGLFLILNLDFNLGITLPFDMLFWHVEAGIVMGIIAAFHIIWHWRYFLKMVKTEA